MQTPGERAVGRLLQRESESLRQHPCRRHWLYRGLVLPPKWTQWQSEERWIHSELKLTRSQQLIQPESGNRCGVGDVSTKGASRAVPKLSTACTLMPPRLVTKDCRG